jgi:uncharacterized protein (TIGR04222 family)
MNAEHSELLERLKNFSPDASDSTFPFSSRLAKENQWSPAYARRVIEEYKRFAFLAVAAGHPVSPSEDVDQAWHLHLTYSQNYWRVFCPEILRQPFHHQPTKGGADEHEKFSDWYARTLASYETFFGEPPPADIWPPSEARQKIRQHFVRVDRQQHWIVRKPQWRVNPAFVGTLGLILLLACCTGAMFASGTNPLDLRGNEFLIFYLSLFAACFATALWLRRQSRLPAENEKVFNAELSPYEVAYLNGGKILTVNTAIANLIRQNILRLDGGRKKRLLLSGGTPPNKMNELERVICAAAARPGGEQLKEVRMAAKTVVGEISGRLKNSGLVVGDAQANKAVWMPLLIALTAVALGVVKIFIGVQRDKPVGFLIALCVITGIVSLIALARRPLRSRFGDSVLAQFKVQHSTLKQSLTSPTVDPLMFAMGVGLFGLGALDGTAYAGLRKQLQPPGASASGCGSSCGSSCGGGCGSGCGGCGGGGD